MELTPSRMLTAGASKFTGTPKHILSAVQVLCPSALAPQSHNSTNGLTTLMSIREHSLILSTRLELLSSDISMPLKTDGSGSATLTRQLSTSNSMMAQSTVTSNTSLVASLQTHGFSPPTSAFPSVAIHSLDFQRSM